MRSFAFVASLVALVSCVAAAKPPTATNKVFFDIEIDGVASGRIVMELYGKVCSGASALAASR